MSASKAVSKYLKQWAEPEVALAQGFAGHHRAALVVPVRDEAVTFIDGLRPALQHTPGTLVIVVVNSDSVTSTSARLNNQKLLTELAQLGPTRDLQLGCQTVDLGCARLLVVDRSSEGRRLPPDQGVGLARKIGCDVALALWARGAVHSPWLLTTDADAQLPTDYFLSPALAQESAGALLWDFVHSTSGVKELDAASFEYEAYLRYTVLGLRWAGSPYAFHTLGSCLGLHAEAYATVRGFPKRAAGEDFHLLSKLAKVATVQRVSGSPIRIQSRRSQRAPFGTGARVEAMLQGEELGFLHPGLYTTVRAVLVGLKAWAATPCAGVFEQALQELPETLRIHTQAALQELGLPHAFHHSVQVGGHAEGRLQHLYTWFDGLKTLRLQHLLESKAGLARLNWADALRTAPFLGELNPTLNPEHALPALRVLERSGPEPLP